MVSERSSGNARRRVGAGLPFTGGFATISLLTACQRESSLGVNVSILFSVIPCVRIIFAADIFRFVHRLSVEELHHPPLSR